MHERKEARDEVKIDKKVEEDTLVQKPETELRTSRVSTSDISKASIVLKDSEALSDCGEIQKVRAAFIYLCKVLHYHDCLILIATSFRSATIQQETIPSLSYKILVNPK